MSFRRLVQAATPFKSAIYNNANILAMTRGVSTSGFNPLAELPRLAPDRDAQDPSQKHDPLFQPPLQIQPTHGVVSCNLHFRSYYNDSMDFYIDFARRAAHALNIPCSGPIPLKTQIERWAVPKSPFVHKKTQQVFERKTHKRFIQIKDAHPQTLQFLLDYLLEHNPPGLGMRVYTYEFEDADSVINQLEKKNKVTLSDPTPKPKLLADKIMAELKKNPNQSIETLGQELYKKMFNAELPDFYPLRKVKKQKK